MGLISGVAMTTTSSYGLILSFQLGIVVRSPNFFLKRVGEGSRRGEIPGKVLIGPAGATCPLLNLEDRSLWPGPKAVSCGQSHWIMWTYDGAELFSKNC